MKILINILFFLLLLTACSKKEEVKFEAFSPEAFAYDIGDSWEVNATINVRGFLKNQQEENLLASISYSVDVVKPDGTIMKNVFSDSVEFSDKELTDVQLEAQFEMSADYDDGIYEIIFNVTDNISLKVSEGKVSFKLES